MGSVATLAVLLLAFGVWVGCQRTWLHPLRAFPGPKLAALTVWYRAYFDLYKRGSFLRHLEYLHTIYGPVVRTGPNELHFSNPAVYAEIYTRGSHFTKDPTLYRCFGSDSSFAIIDPQKSKRRRELLGPLFTRRAILDLEDVMQSKVDKLISRLHSHGKEPVNMTLALRSLTMDIITSYCFSQAIGALDAIHYDHPVLVTNSSTNIWVARYFPFVRTLVMSLPMWIKRRMPSFRRITALRLQIAAKVDAVLADSQTLDAGEHKTVYHHLLAPQPGKAHHQPLSRASLINEGLLMLIAGSDTVANTSSLGLFHALSDKNILANLLSELHDAWPDKSVRMGFTSLEKLPYLTAFIKESFRMAHGTVTPHPRVVGPGDVTLGGYHVPQRTVVAIGTTFLHDNPTIFPEPFKFSPERWLQPNAKDLEAYLVPFSKGPRMCMGATLSWCELYLVFANLLGKVDVQVHNTTLDDFKYREYFNPTRVGDFYAIVAETFN